MKQVLLWLIRFYRSAISPRKPGMCKYIPTCSQYGLEAIERFGALKGGALTVWRIATPGAGAGMTRCRRRKRRKPSWEADLAEEKLSHYADFKFFR